MKNTHKRFNKFLELLYALLFVKMGTNFIVLYIKCFCPKINYQKLGTAQENNYSRAHLIHTANARKNHANYPSMQIIRAYFTLHSYEQQRVVSRASMRIKWGMQISEGHIIRAILYLISGGSRGHTRPPRVQILSFLYTNFLKNHCMRPWRPHGVGTSPLWEILDPPLLMRQFSM